MMKMCARPRPKRVSPACLFGFPDPLEIEKAYQEALMESGDSFLKKWNFNPFTCMPCAQPVGLQWEEGRGEAEDRLAAEVDSLPSPEGRVQDTNAEVTTCSPVSSRKVEPVRYSPYQKQQKLTDYWRTAKAPSHTTSNKRQSKKSEEAHIIAQRETP